MMEVARLEYSIWQMYKDLLTREIILKFGVEVGLSLKKSYLGKK